MNTQVNVQAMPTILEASNQSHWLIHTQVQYYTLSPNSSYHYEFRYQLLKKDSSHRLILLLGGHKRKCIDWWIFSVGRRILSAIRSSNYSILTVCSARSTFDYNIPIEENQDVKWIYKSLQVWMNDVYYAKYEQYPLLYLYGVSRGSHFAGLLCRVLPVQAQILYIYPGYFEGMTIRSVLDRDLQTRLIVDSTFASWFHFKLCYTMTFDLCLFQSNKISNFSPVPPTYFVHVVNDNKLNESDYTRLIAAIKDDSYELGGLVLNDTESLKLHISFPPNATPSYMQEHFYQWRHKLHASQLLYEHLSGFPKLPEQQNSEYKFQTFWCHRGDFTFFERYPSIMQTWNEKEQEEYREYSNDIKTFHEQLTEEFCGDLRGQHAMLSLDIEDALFWLFANFTDEQFKAHVSHYSNHYFEPIIDRIRYEFPYWTMTDKPGSNHLIAFVGGRNMGVLDNRLQNLLKNVIQLGPTGVRQDLLSPNAPELYLHRNLSIVYRHGYDIVAPPFTPTEIIEINTSNDWYQRKKRLLYFAGILNHSLSSKSVRRLLFAFAKNLSSLIRIGKKEFHPITVVDGHVPMQEYLESIMSSVFFLCPEGYSPWSPRIYEAINLGSIPLILADGIVLPFERFIPWRSFSLKLNVSNVYNILDFVIGNSNSNFEERTKRKKRNAQRYMNAFRWLFKNDRNKQKPDFFIPEEDVKTNVFHYIYRELKCRRIEQFLGASWNIFSSASISARQQTCVKYSHICPCTIEEPIAFDQYNYGNQHSHKQPST
ncbi:unnamed protein product [Rotaria magnacalcarata]|uniref:Exostosin GT47 domain-containing protein n=1 Tax=Rotaria magnacalcarata TaxID=392030 RepID=A0A820GJX5_9BILA|nr:unnamed protein product [Rotaria magnacalcarata]